MERYWLRNSLSTRLSDTNRVRCTTEPAGFCLGVWWGWVQSRSLTTTLMLAASNLLSAQSSTKLAQFSGGGASLLLAGGGGEENKGEGWACLREDETLRGEGACG
jgi:hypothetical protein